VACDGGLENCAIASFPWIIAGLVAMVVVLALIWLTLQFRDYFAGRRSSAPPAPRKEPKVVPAGSPLAPAPPDEEPPQRQPEDKRPPKPVPSAKPTPLQLRVEDRPDLRLADFRGDLGLEGDFGELLTSAYLSSQGWKQLQSKVHGGQGIDGIFVRELRGGGGFECLAVEGKTNGASYSSTSMSDEKLEADIARLYELGALTKTEADELLRALAEGPSFFRKELWRHDLSSGLTTVTELGRKGEKGKSVTRSNARLMSAMYLALEQFDRGALYLGDRPVDDDAH
jgi:hypothetical protein